MFTGAPRGPFVSPDGQWIGFVDAAVLKKVAITGGPAVTLATLDGVPRGATWGPDDTIIVATNDVATGLQRITRRRSDDILTRPDRAQGEADHLWPELLPGGRGPVYDHRAHRRPRCRPSGRPRSADRHAHGARPRRQSTAPLRCASGHLVYAAAGALRAVPFDLARLQTRGTPVPVVPDVVTTA